LISAIKSDVFTFLSKCATQYDIIFADPPYDLDDEKFIQLVNTVFENNLLTEAGLLILEHAPQSDFSLHPNFTEKRKYGSSVFDFFAHQKV
jgi:16S rRNA G966 N2-methylase RsmD